MSDDRQKQLKDYSSEVKEKLPQYTAKVKKGDQSALDEALSNLLSLEKRTRLAADGKSTAEVATAILRVCVETGNWSSLNDHISILCKRRAQLQKVMETVIQQGATYVSQTPDEKTKRQLIETLRTVSAGKIFVELERARLTSELARMEEKEGKVASAADILQEIQVETIGSMEAREKAEMLLEQIRLCLAKKDYIRTEIIAKKVDTKQLNDEKFQDLKIKFYTLQISYHTHFSSYFEICSAWREIYHTPIVQADAAQWKPALQNLVVFSLLAPWDSEISDITHRILTDKKLFSLPAYRQLLEAYTGDEVMTWPLPQESEIKQNDIFKDDGNVMSDVTSATDDADKIPHGSSSQRWSDLHKRIVQHNIRTIAKYYTQITSKRLSTLLNLEESRTEIFLSEMVSSKQLFAKIDRPIGHIRFEATQSPIEQVNAWSSDITALLNLVETTCHMINKENMIHKINTKSS